MVSFGRSGGLEQSPGCNQNGRAEYETGTSYLKVLGKMNILRTNSDMQEHT